MMPGDDTTGEGPQKEEVGYRSVPPLSQEQIARMMAAAPELGQALAMMAERAGVQVPALASRDAPTIQMEWGWNRVGQELGGIIKGKNIFLRGDTLVTVCERTGTWRPFDPRNFAGWVERFAAFTYEGKRHILLGEHANMIMSQFTFREQMRELESVNKIRLPVKRASGEIEWLAKGYDAETKSYTAPVLEYDMEWPLDQAMEFFAKQHEGFCWLKAEHDTESTPAVLNRNFSVHVAGMVGMYCKALFPAGEARPMLTYISNQSGTGKSTLALMAMTPVHGMMAAGSLCKDETELVKALDTVAQTRRPVLWLDDIGQHMYSHKLNLFLTSPRVQGRKFGKNDEEFDVEQICQVVATGNDVKASRDLARRSLVVEMFFAGDVEKRLYPRELSAAYLARPEVRTGFLSACCALVKRWASASEGERSVLAKITGRGTARLWTKTVAEIVTLAGFGDPLLDPSIPMDEDEDQMRDLLMAAWETKKANYVWNRHEMVELARDKELLEELVGSKGDKDLDQKQNKRFGRQLQRWRGRELVSPDGGRFKFGHQKQKAGATYPMTALG